MGVQGPFAANALRVAVRARMRERRDARAGRLAPRAQLVKSAVAGGLAPGARSTCLSQHAHGTCARAHGAQRELRHTPLGRLAQAAKTDQALLTNIPHPRSGGSVNFTPLGRIQAASLISFIAFSLASCTSSPYMANPRRVMVPSSTVTSASVSPPRLGRAHFATPLVAARCTSVHAPS